MIWRWVSTPTMMKKKTTIPITYKRNSLRTTKQNTMPVMDISPRRCGRYIGIGSGIARRNQNGSKSLWWEVVHLSYSFDMLPNTNRVNWTSYTIPISVWIRRVPKFILTRWKKRIYVVWSKKWRGKDLSCPLWSQLQRRGRLSRRNARVKHLLGMGALNISSPPR